MAVSGEQKLIIGTADSRIQEFNNNSFTDFSSTPIVYRIGTGTIYPGQDPLSLKVFRAISFYFRPPSGQFTFTATVRVDNLPGQAYAFTASGGGDALDSTFILGSSTLGTSTVFAPFTVGIDGIGRGINIEVVQSGTAEQVDLYGYAIEWEPADIRHETV
jgi:hypothetical protein